MAVGSITNLIQNISEQFPGQTQDPQPVTSALRTGNAGSTAVAEDTYTPSAQNKFAPTSAQDAGIIQVNQGTLATGPENYQFALVGANTVQNGTPTQAVFSTPANSGNTQTAAAQNNSGTKAANQTGATPAAQTTAVPAATEQAQNQIQALNAALPALGLTNEEIQQIDRIASLAGNFNPAAYASLVSQFESLAQQAAQQGVPTPGAAAIQGAAAPSNPAVSVNGVTYQLQGALIHFSAQKGAADSGAGNGNGQGQGNTTNNGQDNAGGLQLAQVQFTLSTANGQTVQVQAPQLSPNAGTANLQTPQIVAFAG